MLPSFGLLDSGLPSFYRVISRVTEFYHPTADALDCARCRHSNRIDSNLRESGTTQKGEPPGRRWRRPASGSRRSAPCRRGCRRGPTAPCRRWGSSAGCTVRPTDHCVHNQIHGLGYFHLHADHIAPMTVTIKWPSILRIPTPFKKEHYEIISTAIYLLCFLFVFFSLLTRMRLPMAN